VKEDPMTERICEHCGKQFLAETIRDKLKEARCYLSSVLLPCCALYCFRQRGGWPLALICLAAAGSACYQIYRGHEAKKGKSVKLGCKCPGCGSRSEDVDSPLGEQLIAYWSSPHTEEQQGSIEEPPTISGDGEEAGAVVAHNGSPCE
jgi:hypothetical protein